MKEKVKIVIQVIVLLVVAKLCVMCGEITGESFSYGVIWCIIAELVLRTEITVTDIDENGNEMRKRIY